MSFWAIKSTYKSFPEIAPLYVSKRAADGGTFLKGVYTTRAKARVVLRGEKAGYRDYYAKRRATVVKVRITVEEVK